LNFPAIDVVYVSQAISEFKVNFSEIQKVCSKFTINGKEFSQKVLVLPQGLGIWYDCDKPSDALIIDIGFNTVDVLRIKNSKPQPENSLSILGTGVVIMANLFSELLSEELKSQFNIVESNKILMDGGTFRYNRHDLNFSDDVMRLKKVYTEKLLTDIFTNPHIAKTIGNVENLIIAGGGAYFIDKKIQEDQNIYIPDKPEFSNVLGFIKHSQSQ
jgi:plasmid segregation protein ParM